MNLAPREARSRCLEIGTAGVLVVNNVGKDIASTPAQTLGSEYVVVDVSTPDRRDPHVALSL